MKISHEVPVAYLEQSRKFNDYDYALVHIFDQNMKYYNFFKDSVLNGRQVILDNSAYEISVREDLKDMYPKGMYPMKKYYEWIAKLQPTYYVLPDSKLDTKSTMKLTKQWAAEYGCTADISNIKRIGVVHGGSIADMQRCYDEMYEYADILAFSFESWWFKYAEKYNIPVEWIRPIMLNKLNIDHRKPHHILGCVLPKEFKAYVDCPWIESIDTSAPVTNALEGIEFDMDTQYKPKTTIAEAFDIEYNAKTLKLIKQNVSTFRKSIK